MTTANDQLIDRIRAAGALEAAYIPVHARFGVRAIDAQPGRTTFGQEIGPHLLDARGLLCPGAFLIAADAALGSAIATGLPPQRSVMSLSIHVQFVTLDPGAARDFAIRAESVHVGERSAFSVGTIIDDAGRTVAHISSQCGFVATPRTLGPFAPMTTFDPIGPAEPSEGGLAAVAVRRAGARLARAVDGEVTVVATSTPDVRNSRGDLQGGVLGLLAEQAISACLVRSSPALGRAATMELGISYVRAVRADHPRVEITARTEHPGRRFAVARAQGRDDSGRVVVLASGSRY
jgi:uncharacterized protein (TIGR00369 family)